MGITNRAKDSSEQREVFEAHYALTATGVTIPVCVVPFASTLDAVRVAAHGLSGSPTYQLAVNRFITGAGLTTMTAAATLLTATAFGTSGLQSVVLAASGSSFLNLMAGDVVFMASGAANTAVNSISVAVVLKALQDIKTNFGV